MVKKMLRIIPEVLGNIRVTTKGMHGLQTNDIHLHGYEIPTYRALPPQVCLGSKI